MKKGTVWTIFVLVAVLVAGGVLTACTPASQLSTTPTQATQPQTPTTQPTQSQPVTTTPDASESQPTEPVTTQPAATEPVATEPVATEPVATQPDPTEPAPTNPEPTQPPRTEPTAPLFTLYDETGKAVNLSDYIGKPIVLNFWASWCGPCRYEMPEFQKLYQELGDEVHFLMVNLTVADTMADAKAFIQQQGYTFPVLYDLTGQGGHVYGITAFPTTFFIDAEGYLMHTQVGAMNETSLRYYIGKIL